MMNIQLNDNHYFNELIKNSVPLHDKNWFSTGGPAQFFAQPRNATEFCTVLQFAEIHFLPIFILGNGANVLISDEGFAGMVIQPLLNKITFHENKHGIQVTAGAGVLMHELIRESLHNNALGLEEFSGIPGTVGGSVYINLHYFEFLLEHFLHTATVIHKHTGMVEIVSKEWFNFGYNTSKLQEEEYFLVDATFTLKKGSITDTAFAQGRSKEIIRHRAARYPTQKTCGSFFRNFKEDEVTLISNGKKMIYVAYYFDKIGIKGQLKYGDAAVSYQHANMIVNQGNATSADIIYLARTMQEMVQKEFGIVPKPECRLIGFSTNPLL